MRNFFLPPEGSPLWVRLLPFAVLGVLTLVVLVSGLYAWDYTNSPQFCGTACHTMPPEFTSYLTSPHARIDCVECHIGRGFVATRITRKAGDIGHIVSLVLEDYEFPIHAKSLRPARETCERCHSPEKFSDDSLREIKRFIPDEDNTPTSTYLTMKTGGGTARAGLGRGIHWHIENDIRYLALDPREQEIPYVAVFNEDGSVTEYVDTESGLVPETVDPSYLRQMDCITCHNRITHLIPQPVDTVDELMSRGAISPDIPEIRRKAVEVYHLDYPDLEAAQAGIAELADYYESNHPEFFAANEPLVAAAIGALQEAYLSSVFPKQKADWTSHADNVGHINSPGCFRCHDGKHLNAKQESIRLECNLCHSIPVVAGPSDFVAKIEISRGPEPGSHLNPNWIGLHRDVFDPSCSNCHTTDDPGGTSDTSFCSNSACHGIAWVYAGFDAPSLRDVLRSQLDLVITETELEDLTLSYDGAIGPLLEARCGACHGDDGLQGLNVTTYKKLMQGGASGLAILPGDPEGSPLVLRQSGDEAHFGQLAADELDLVIEWIAAGAPE
ncbi:MAG: hypothetical protein BMS9Abin28_0105 [Anaerolineae bacterium]|nr:MAG: hypothetical protein BMS9Abin28_0105 [Anaerolineae bacterium]